MKTLGERIKEERTKQNISSVDMAEKLSIPESRYLGFEANKSVPSQEQLNKIAYLLHTTAERLSKDEGTIEQGNYGICDHCHSLLKGPDDIHDVTFTKKKRVGRSTKTETIKERYCSICYEQYLLEKKEEQEKLKKERIAKAQSRRNRAKFLSPFLSAVTTLIVTLIVYFASYSVLATVLTAVLLFLYLIPFFVCLFLNNNSVIYILGAIASIFFVHFPSVIFSFDTDGLKALLAIKFLFGIIGFAVGALGLLIGVAISSFVALFLFVPSYFKSISHPEYVTF